MAIDAQPVDGSWGTICTIKRTPDGRLMVDFDHLLRGWWLMDTITHVGWWLYPWVIRGYTHGWCLLWRLGNVFKCSVLLKGRFEQNPRPPTFHAHFAELSLLPISHISQVGFIVPGVTWEHPSAGRFWNGKGPPCDWNAEGIESLTRMAIIRTLALSCCVGWGSLLDRGTLSFFSVCWLYHGFCCI